MAGRFSWRRLGALIAKESLHIRRDPRSLAMAFVMPLVLLVLFGWAITLDIQNLNVAVYDRDQTQPSRSYLRAFEGSSYFTLIAHVEDYPSLTRLLDSGEADLAVVLYPGFAEALEAGRSAPAQVIADGADANTGTIALGYAEAVTNRFNAELVGGLAEPAIDNRLRVWYNPELKSRWFIVPGLIAVIMTVITALLTSLTVSREWEQGTMEQLIATPVQGVELLVGKMTPYLIIGLVDVLVSVAMAIWVFGVPLRGSFWFLMASGTLFMLGGLGLGILISTVARSQLVASQVAMVATFIPAFLLSGFLYSIDNMPPALQWVTHAVQARYYVAILKDVFLKASPPIYLVNEVLFLTVFAIVVLGLALFKFKKRID
ncbi:ABC transporter permease [Pistricoccus aurantiacus]|uniref:ABC transporter permease n=1 Tax=Pistricoccus aurantiacus TaxID=1883414 RepID=A0A5B8SUX0_9GAMM|nr:ABC transporter permease [Pistricoccus aurantiacus]